MKQAFQLENVKCGGCANMLKSKLKERFGEIEVDLEVYPGTIILDIGDEETEEPGEGIEKARLPL